MPLILRRPVVVASPPAATLWVNPATGDDSRSKATVAASGGSLPWATIGRAVWGSTNRATPNTTEAADAGDVVSVAAGTYAYAGTVSSKSIPVYNAANSGTLGNPITFRADGVVVLSAVSANSPVIGAYQRDYIKWTADRVTGYWAITCDGRVPVDEVDTDDTKTGDVVNTKPDTGPVTIWDCTGTTIEGCTIDGGPSINYTDNWNGVRVENGTGFTIRNNVIANFTRSVSGGTNHNQTCITLYGAKDGIIEHNDLSNAGAGVYFKDTGVTNAQNNNRVRYNAIHGVLEAVAFSITAEDRNYVYQNLITGCDFGLVVTGGGLSNDWIFNNTYYNCAQAVVYLANSSGSGGRFWNNIAHTSPIGIATNGFTMVADTVFDGEHNCWFNLTNFYNGSDGNRTFASFKGAYADQEQAATVSVESDPLFVTNGSNFHLQGGSPAATLGVDLGDLDVDGSTVDAIPAGCYVSGTETMGVV